MHFEVKMLDAIKSWIPLIVAVVAFALGNIYGQARVQEQWTKADNAELTAYKTKALEVISFSYSLDSV